MALKGNGEAVIRAATALKSKTKIERKDKMSIKGYRRRKDG